MTTPAHEIRHSTYPDAIDRLLAGRPEEAARLLEDMPRGERTREADLALAKAYLELGQGAAAAVILDDLVAVAESDQPSGLRAYLTLLSAKASALAGHPEEAACVLAEVGAIDPRMEHAAGDMERRIERGRPPAFRF